MKRLLDRIFKKEPQLNYIIPEYQPVEVNFSKYETELMGSECDEAESIKAIEINHVGK